MSPVDLQKFLAGKTVGASPYLNSNDEGIEGSCTVKDLETFLQTGSSLFYRNQGRTKIVSKFCEFTKKFPAKYTIQILSPILEILFQK